MQNVDRPLRLLLLSDLLTMLALMVGQVAMPWWITGEGGARDLALYGVITSGAAVLAMPALSPLGDRLPKRMVLSGGLAAFVLGALAMVAFTAWGHYRFAAVVAVGVLAVWANAAVVPVMLSIVPDMVPADRMPAALGLQKSAQAVGRMIGPALGGLVLAVAGTVAAFVCYACMLIVAVWAAARIETPHAPPRQAHARHWGRDMLAGLRAKWAVPLDRYWTLAGCLMMLFFLPATGMLAPLRVRELGLSAAWLGACEAALSLGLLVGSAWAAGRLSARLGRLGATFTALTVSGLGFVAIGLVHWPIMLVALFAVVGVCLATTQLVGQTHRLLAIPEHFRSRMTAVNVMAAQIAGSLGPALAGALLVHWSVAWVYVVMGVGFLASSALLMMVPGYAAFLALDHESVKGWFARQHPEAFR